MKKSFFACAIISIFLLPVASFAQKKAPAARSKASASTAAKIEPLRIASGLMQDNRISIRRSDWINDGAPLFDFTLAHARVTDGRLVFTGLLKEPGKAKAEVVTATLVSTVARSANPWPNASAPTAKDRKAASKSPESQAAGEKNEQNQSLYSSVEVGSGCELIYLKMQAPKQSAPIQVGVVLAHQDNQVGEEINQAVCRLVRAMKAKESTDEALSKLNRLISHE